VTVNVEAGWYLIKVTVPLLQLSETAFSLLLRPLRCPFFNLLSSFLHRKFLSHRDLFSFNAPFISLLLLYYILIFFFIEAESYNLNEVLVVIHVSNCAHLKVALHLV